MHMYAHTSKSKHVYRLQTMLLMLSAPQAVNNLSWLALLAGVVVALKVHWVVVGFHAIGAKRVV